ncbi:MAG: hypothetical protein HYV76_02760 [Candidatus Vogelbacteria bacterium]|nr:hypothetical protein [Candidatus Vogelbacteria bacterium]
MTPKHLVIFLLGLSIALFAYTRVQALIAGPEIIVTTPKDGETVTETIVTLTGTAKRIALITLNGRQIFTNEAGHFKEELLLAYGYNILELKAQDNFGRITTQTLRLVLN